MKTASQMLDDNLLTGKLKCHDSELCERDRDDIIFAMQEFAREVATEALKLAAENATNDLSEYPIIKVSKESILSTDITDLLK